MCPVAKTYMPAALFNAGSGGEEDLPPLGPDSSLGGLGRGLELGGGEC